jgi:hypothetical protein
LTETDEGLNGEEMELGWMELPEETEPGADEECPREAWRYVMG